MKTFVIRIEVYLQVKIYTSELGLFEEYKNNVRLEFIPVLVYFAYKIL